MAVEAASVGTLHGQPNFLLRKTPSLLGVRSFKDRGSQEPLLFACHKIDDSYIVDTSYFETWINKLKTYLFILNICIYKN